MRPVAHVLFAFVVLALFSLVLSLVGQDIGWEERLRFCVRMILCYDVKP